MRRNCVPRGVSACSTVSQQQSWSPQVTPEQIASAVHEEVAANEAKLRAERCVRMQHWFSALGAAGGCWGFEHQPVNHAASYCGCWSWTAQVRYVLVPVVSAARMQCCNC